MIKKFIWPKIEKEEKEAVIKQLDESISIYNRSGIIEDLENELKEYFKSDYSVLTNSGTTALHSIFVGINLGPEDEIICPAYTFYATVTPILFTGAIPILADCDENGNIDPFEIEKKITGKTKAIIVTHMWGMPCQMNKIIDIAKKYNLYLLEDCSHAHGAAINNKFVGTFGDASAFSIQGQKVLTGGEGGFVLTNNPEIYHRTLLLGHYNKRCKQEIPSDSIYAKYSITGMGLKYRIHPLACAIAQQQLKKLNVYLEGRKKHAEYIIKELKNLKGIRIPKIPKNTMHSWYAFIIKYIPQELNNVPIKKFHQFLLNNGCVDADIPGSTCPLNILPLFQEPGFLFPTYNNKFSYKKGDFPNAEKFYKSIIKIPVWDDISDINITKHYVSKIKEFIKIHEVKND